jgi:hypothetical protein
VVAGAWTIPASTEGEVVGERVEETLGAMGKRFRASGRTGLTGEGCYMAVRFSWQGTVGMAQSYGRQWCLTGWGASRSGISGGLDGESRGAHGGSRATKIGRSSEARRIGNLDNTSKG